MVVAASGGRARNLTTAQRRRLVSGPGAGRALDRVLLDARRRAGHLGDRQDGSQRRLTRDGSLNEYPDVEPEWPHDRLPEHARRRVRALRHGERRPPAAQPHPPPVGGQVGRGHPTARGSRSCRCGMGARTWFVMRGRACVRNVTRTPRLQESHPSWSPDAELDVLPSRRQRPDRTLEHPCGCRRRPTAGYSRGAGLRLRLGSDLARWASSQASRLPVAGPESRPRGRPGRGRTARRSR